MAELLTKADLQVALQSAIAPLETKIDQLARRIENLTWAQELDSLFERQVWQLTIRWGIMLAVGFGALVAFLKLT